MTISDFIERKMKEFEKRFTVKTFSTTGEMRIMAGGKIQEGKMLVYHTGEVSAKPIVDFLRTFSQELIEKIAKGLPEERNIIHERTGYYVEGYNQAIQDIRSRLKEINL